MTVTAVGLQAAKRLDEDLDKYSSVSIYCGPEACSAASALSGSRYLVDEAPSLPLPRCSAETCQCGYFTYRDRRSFLTNRRANSRLEATSRHGLWRDNRRAGEDRRRINVSFER